MALVSDHIKMTFVTLKIVRFHNAKKGTLRNVFGSETLEDVSFTNALTNMLRKEQLRVILMIFLTKLKSWKA